MRREGRQKNIDNGFRNLMFWSGGILLIAVIAFVITFAIYSNKIKQDSRISTLNSEKVAELIPSIQTEEQDESVSSSIGKTVEQMQNSVSESTKNTNSTNTMNNTENSFSNKKTNNIDSVETNQNKKNEVKEEEIEKKQLNFEKPVEGEIVKEFAKDNLIYSETLKEWITHLGIDIKAEKTSVVKSAEAGIIKSIKNDPRYGLTVVIEHDDGYKTVYSNLLTAEFVSEGEKIERGQTIGTVGTTAIFEVSDEPHLHFEIIKDGEYLDPTIYLK